MKWIVGLDLRPLSHGAINFASWLAATSQDSEELVGIHVIEERVLLNALRDRHLDEVLAAAREEAHNTLRELGAAARFAAVDVVTGVHAERCLEETRIAHGADAFIIGRHAPCEGASLIRLGRVARRMLRALPAPVVVVPPDLPAEDLGGPVMALTDCRTDSVAAVQWAQRTATSLGLSLWAVHAIETDQLYAPYLSPEVIDASAVELLDQGRARLTAWVREHGIEGGHSHTLGGEPVRESLALARDARPTLLVAGARRLGPIEAFFTNRVGSELAAQAAVPVAVVPGPGRQQ